MVWFELDRQGSELPRWEPLVWESTSSAMILLLLFAVVAFDRRYPIERPNVLRHLRYHVLFTLVFSLVHVVGMVGLRKLIYWSVGRGYDFGHWPAELAYEFLKDFRTYFSLLAVIYLYRFFLRRWQGEAEFLSEGLEEAQPEPVTDRFLVKKLGREFLVRVKDIDWIEAAGNYVNLHVGERLYPLRETMTSMERRLDDRGFVRVHRSAIVNLERVEQIVPYASGDGHALLVSQDQVAVSRRYRKQLRERLS